jgi:ABC-2 type transport system ATP-binding protein
MNTETPVIDIRDLARRYGRTDAVSGLNLRVAPGRSYGFFGRNGAGKTTTIKRLLNLLRPTSGEVRVFGLDPRRDEVAVQSRLAYVPDHVAFYPWMTVRDALEYFAAFRPRWNRDTERALLDRFRLGERHKATHLSKGQRTQLALIGAICPEPELLVLDEPTSGLDPIVRREFIETVIGAYQDGDPGQRTVFVSTHLISEFEGLIDEFTIIDEGRDVLTLDADEARSRYQKIHVRFGPDSAALRAFGTPGAPRVPDVAGARGLPGVPGARVLARRGRDIELVVNGDADDVLGRLRALAPESMTTEALTLEEIFVATLKTEAAPA